MTEAQRNAPLAHFERMIDDDPFAFECEEKSRVVGTANPAEPMAGQVYFMLLDISDAKEAEAATARPLIRIDRAIILESGARLKMNRERHLILVWVRVSGAIRDQVSSRSASDQCRRFIEGGFDARQVFSRPFSHDQERGRAPFGALPRRCHPTDRDERERQLQFEPSPLPS